MKVDLKIESRVSSNVRVEQLAAMFDVPPNETSNLHWQGDFPFDDQPWNVGLIVGPSGSGKTQIMRHVFGEPKPFAWGDDAVIADFSSDLSMTQIAEVCQAVGFNTIPAWMRPYHVLSNGEKFRVEMARALLEGEHRIVVDEFTSVVDRQVAKIGAHAIQKFIRRHDRQFVAVGCHYDVIEWLQPDWVLEPATMTFTRRSLRRRPQLDITIQRVPYETWRLFAPFHYLTAELHPGAACFGLFVGDDIAAFAGVLYRPHPKMTNIYGVSRLVTLPDWQGLGLAMSLVDHLGAAYRADKKQLRTYPAHPALVRTFAKSAHWSLEKMPGKVQRRASRDRGTAQLTGTFGGRPCAVFRYVGDAHDDADASHRLLQGVPT